MPVRRIPRSRTRAEFWVTKLEGTQSGEEALADAWRWFRKELTALTEARPATGEAAAWDMARKVAGYAARLSRARIQLRRGLEPAERDALLNPWATQGDNPR
ncbi:MAG: hypothetical protein ACRDN1_00885 [Trebonia sp.]